MKVPCCARHAALGIAALTLCAAVAAQTPGATVESLLAYARASNPEFAAMQREADAAAARIVPAGNLPDPVVAVEWRDITRDGDGGPNLLPARVGSMKYTVRQMLPWPGISTSASSSLIRFSESSQS